MIREELQGLWYVKAVESNRLSVQKRNLDKQTYSYWFTVCDSEEDMHLINDQWHSKPTKHLINVNHEDLMFISWPSYLKPTEAVYITVTPSGDHYVEDS